MVDTIRNNEARSEGELQKEAARQVLNEYLKPEVSKKNPRMISVGCQFGYEADPFMDMFPGGEYLGIDKEEYIIGGARKLHVPNAKVSFDTRDARDINSFGDQRWDVVFLGHPQVLGSFSGGGTGTDWVKIIQNSVQALNEEGRILATTHTPEEAGLVEGYLKKAGLHTTRFENPNPVIRSVHADIIIGKK